MMIAWYPELNSNGHPNRGVGDKLSRRNLSRRKNSNLETVYLDVHGRCTNSLFLHVFVFKLLDFELLVV